LRQLQRVAGVRIARMHPHMLRHTYVTTMQVRGIASDATFGEAGDRLSIGVRALRSAAAA
jgi:hypothetical protein